MAIVTLSPRVYYLFPAFPVLFAGGAVLWEHFLKRPKLRWLKLAYPALMLAGTWFFQRSNVPVKPATDITGEPMQNQAPVTNDDLLVSLAEQGS